MMSRFAEWVQSVGAGGYLGTLGAGVAVLVILGTWADVSAKRAHREHPEWRAAGDPGAGILLISGLTTIGLSVLWGGLLAWL